MVSLLVPVKLVSAFGSQLPVARFYPPIVSALMVLYLKVFRPFHEMVVVVCKKSNLKDSVYIEQVRHASWQHFFLDWDNNRSMDSRALRHCITECVESVCQAHYKYPITINYSGMRQLLEYISTLIIPQACIAVLTYLVQSGLEVPHIVHSTLASHAMQTILPPFATRALQQQGGHSNATHSAYALSSAETHYGVALQMPTRVSLQRFQEARFASTMWHHVLNEGCSSLSLDLSFSGGDDFIQQQQQQDWTCFTLLKETTGHNSFLSLALESAMQWLIEYQQGGGGGGEGGMGVSFYSGCLVICPTGSGKSSLIHASSILFPSRVSLLVVRTKALLQDFVSGQKDATAAIGWTTLSNSPHLMSTLLAPGLALCPIRFIVCTLHSLVASQMLKNVLYMLNSAQRLCGIVFDEVHLVLVDDDNNNNNNNNNNFDNLFANLKPVLGVLFNRFYHDTKGYVASGGGGGGTIMLPFIMGLSASLCHDEENAIQSALAGDGAVMVRWSVFRDVNVHGKHLKWVWPKDLWMQRIQEKAMATMLANHLLEQRNQLHFSQFSIVFVPSVSHVELYSKELKKKQCGPIFQYHAKFTEDLANWLTIDTTTTKTMELQVPRIMVSTCALGVGCDFNGCIIGHVYIMESVWNIDCLVQFGGRTARGQSSGECHLWLNKYMMENMLSGGGSSNVVISTRNSRVLSLLCRVFSSSSTRQCMVQALITHYSQHQNLALKCHSQHQCCNCYNGSDDDNYVLQLAESIATTTTSIAPPRPTKRQLIFSTPSPSPPPSTVPVLNAWKCVLIATQNMHESSFKASNGMCIKCGAFGHYSRACPFKGVRVNFTFGVCFKCWAPSHEKNCCFKQEHIKRTICSLYFHENLRKKVESMFNISIPCTTPQSLVDYFCRNANFMYKAYVFIISENKG